MHQRSAGTYSSISTKVFIVITIDCVLYNNIQLALFRPYYDVDTNWCGNRTKPWDFMFLTQVIVTKNSRLIAIVTLVLGTCFNNNNRNSIICRANI